jgi:hypothetical protein
MQKILKLNDKFNIIENNTKHFSLEQINKSIEDIVYDILNCDNYNNIIQLDLIKQILWFNKNISYEKIVDKQFNKYIKFIKKNIIKKIQSNKFNINEDLNTFINNYCYKINKIKLLFDNNNNIDIIAFTYLYENIISEPLVINILQNEIPCVNNIIFIIKMIKILSELDILNPKLKSKNWFLNLISLSLKLYEEKNIINYQSEIYKNEKRQDYLQF